MNPGNLEMLNKKRVKPKIRINLKKLKYRH